MKVYSIKKDFNLNSINYKKLINVKLINKKDKIYIAGRGMAGKAIEKAFRKFI